MALSQLRDEYEHLLIGPLILERVSRLTRRYLLRRDPRIYSRGAYDVRDGLEDAVNDFVLDVLIGERQIDYVIRTAEDGDQFDALVNRQLRRYLARTRLRTVVDNLIDRSVVALRKPPFRAQGRGLRERFILANADASDLPLLTESEARKAAWLARRIPKELGQGKERAPRIYDAAALANVLAFLFQTGPVVLTRHTLQVFFENLLTPWAERLLDAIEEPEAPSSELSPADQSVVSDVALRLLAGMSEEERVIFQYKYANLPDHAVAEALGLSRQSTAPRKKALFDRILSALEGLEPRVQKEMLVRLNIAIATAELDAP